MPLYYSNFKSFSNKISRIFWFEQLFCTAFISYTERPISALGSAWEARARLIWVDFNFVMSQQPPIWWSLNSWAAQANHGHPNPHLTLFTLRQKFLFHVIQKSKVLNLKCKKVCQYCQYYQKYWFQDTNSPLDHFGGQKIQCFIKWKGPQHL